MASRCGFVPICPFCRATIGVPLTLATAYSRHDDTRSIGNSSMPAMRQRHVCQHAMPGVLPAFSGYGVAVHRTLRLTACWHGACDAYAGGCRALMMGWISCHTAFGSNPAHPTLIVRCLLALRSRLVLGKLARRVVNRATALCVEDLDFLVQPAVA